jgi:hypothetical protein
MDMKRELVGRRVVSVSPENGWKFVRTRDGEEYCVAELMFDRGRLTELACYSFDEGGTMYTLHLSPEEVQDMSEISHLVDQKRAGVYMYVFNGQP